MFALDRLVGEIHETLEERPSFKALSFPERHQAVSLQKRVRRTCQGGRHAF